MRDDKALLIQGQGIAVAANPVKVEGCAVQIARAFLLPVFRQQGSGLLPVPGSLGIAQLDALQLGIVHIACRSRDTPLSGRILLLLDCLLQLLYRLHITGLGLIQQLLGLGVVSSLNGLSRLFLEPLHLRVFRLHGLQAQEQFLVLPGYLPQFVIQVAVRNLLLLQYLEEAGKGRLSNGQLACVLGKVVWGDAIVHSNIATSPNRRGLVASSEDAAQQTVKEVVVLLTNGTLSLADILRPAVALECVIRHCCLLRSSCCRGRPLCLPGRKG